MAQIINNSDNWDQLLETPPGWIFSYMDQDNERTVADDEDILAQLQPSTFDFLNDDNEENNDNAKCEKKFKEEKKKATENGTFVYKMPGFIPDSIKFEYALNEIPSRCIMLSNISPYATKADLLYIFGMFGPYQSYGLSKLNKGVASVVFYDLADAQNMRVSSIYIRGTQVMKIFCNDLSKKIKEPENNGTIVIFHIPKDINEDDLNQIFSQFGKIRQIRNTPTKASQKFIEFYDIRAAEKALNYYNGKPLNNKTNFKISIEFSHPGGYKKNLNKYYKTKLPTIERSKNNKKIVF